MARDRSRARRPRSDREGEPVEDTPEEAEPDSGEAERRDRSAGTVEDLANGGRDRVRSETASGSQAALAIDPAINPGFVDTEVVNRMALVLNLNLVWDPDRRHWTPVTTKDLASSAYASGLLQDTITESLGEVLGATDGIDTGEDGSIGLTDGLPAGATFLDPPDRTYAPTRQAGNRILLNRNISEVTIDMPDVETPPTRVLVELDIGSGDTENYPIGSFPVTVPINAIEGDYVGFYLDREGESWTCPGYQDRGSEQQTTIGSCRNGVAFGQLYSSDRYGFDTIASRGPGNSGSASTSFATPPRATRYSRALYNAELNGGSLRVDLYSGDPSSPTSELLARDIGPREDISDIPPSKGPLQLKFTMRRGSQGNSPRVSKAGIQYEQ